MACSSPLKLYASMIKPSLRNNHSDFTTQALRRSFNEQEYINVPCRYCLNCRVDRQNELVDRCEYEYINFGCGSFVTFTYDDVHLHKNSFIDSHSGEYVSSINKKDGKDFLNRLNKLVHAEYKKNGFNPLCRTDYKYVITHEYGDKFKRPHFHCLFFGLDFAYCERLFWRAWNYQGSIQVGAIKNGGIAYAVKYISSQEYGLPNFYKYTYHHLEAPSSSHSCGLGEGLYKGQLKYIKNHDGFYRWHGKDKPVPTYYKNKYNIISDLDLDKYEKRYKANCENIYSLYEYRIKSYKDFQSFNNLLAKQRQENIKIKLQQSGKPVYDMIYIKKSMNDMVYNDNHRLPDYLDKNICRVVDINGNAVVRYGNKTYKQLTNRICMKLGLAYHNLVKIYGYQLTDKMFGLDKPPF